ncbi:MAG: threonine synthase [Actinomycetota bacterium]|nr:threonine synthase [Actinomycetota bacterium]
MTAVAGAATAAIENPQALACRNCGRRYPVEPLSICEDCFGPLEPWYDLGAIDPDVFRKQVESGPQSLWRYEALLPGGPGIERVDLGAGFTPLRRAANLGERLGIDRLWIKDDTVNPTASFKDRVVSVALTMSRAFGFEAVACASTGNLANATAGHAAHARIPAYVFIPFDLERAKVLATAAYGANVIAVDGNYDDVNRLCSEVAETLPWAFVNVNMRPFYAEGSKSLGFETAEQLGWRLPDHCVVPVASGALLTRIDRAFAELSEIGAIERKPVRISGAQAAGCSPVAQAFASGAEEVRPVRPNSIARSLAIGNPADGYYAMQTARRTDGVIDACEEEEVVEGISLLAETEGLFAETAGGVTIACLKRLRESGAIRDGEEVVAYITGSGYKTVEVLEDRVRAPISVAPSLDDFLSKLPK